jgi:hypothetical protein
MITVICNISELRKAIKGLKPALPSSIREQRKLILELDIRPKLLIISIPGVSMKCPLENETFAKAFLPFSLFKEVVGSCKEDFLTLHIENGTLTIGKTSISSDKIALTHFENQTKIDLSVNYTPLEILSLRYTHSFDEIKRRNLHTLLGEAEEKLMKDLQRATNALSDYKVSFIEINALVQSKIERFKT